MKIACFDALWNNVLEVNVPATESLTPARRLCTVPVDFS